MGDPDGCARVLAAIDEHWRGDESLGRSLGTTAAHVRRCLSAALARGEVQTPRGAYAGRLWRRARPPA